MKLYLHIGMQKAGSKAIQGFLAQAQTRLEAQGIDRADDLKAGIWHQGLFMGYDAAQDARMATLARRARAAVLSYERGYCAASETISRLVSHASSVEILFFLRPPVDWLNSMKNQVLKAHRTSLADWRALSVRNGPLAESLRVADQLARWEQAVGRDAIRVARFSPRADVVAPFARWLGLPGALPPAGANPNPALDARSIRIILHLKTRLAETGADPDTLLRAMTLCHQTLRADWVDSRVTTPVMLVTEAEQRLCRDLYAPQFAAVQSRYRQIDIPAPPPEAPAPALTDLSASAEERAVADGILARL